MLSNNGEIMRKILKGITCLLVMGISFCSFAYEATPGVKIISEKFESHGFTNGHIESLPVKKNLKPMYVNALSMTSDAIGHLREHTTVKSWHDVSITNNTSQTQRYTYVYVLSCESLYQNFSRTVEIPARGSFSDSSHNYGDVQKEEIGSFSIKASTQISGGDSGFHGSSARLRIIR